jgi:hypothetical protein
MRWHTTSASSSSAIIIEDIIRLIAPSDRLGFHAMLEHELRGRELPADEVRRIAVDTWRQFLKYGWPTSRLIVRLFCRRRRQPEGQRTLGWTDADS